VKPRIFIGSSSQAARFAGAIHDALAETAECTPWTEGAFGLSRSTLDNLMKNLRDSDFGIFVFAADDVTNIKGDLLNVTRDNVVYEAGLFAGYLSPQRCFIAIPMTAKIRIPSDLLGMTLGRYEDNRTDKNFTSAVSPFCRQVETEIASQGLFSGHSHEQLRELSVKFECCDWIPEDTDSKNRWKTRVSHKTAVCAEIDTFCKANPVNKFRLLQRHRRGYYVALLSAIRIRPEARDHELIMQIQPSNFTQGFNYYKLMDAVEALKSAKLCDREQTAALQEWLRSLSNADDSIRSRIEKLTV
jgi:Predicted nucleotide-binding protein containing TIR-like domain